MQGLCPPDQYVMVEHNKLFYIALGVICSGPARRVTGELGKYFLTIRFEGQMHAWYSSDSAGSSVDRRPPWTTLALRRPLISWGLPADPPVDLA